MLYNVLNKMLYMRVIYIGMIGCYKTCYITRYITCYVDWLKGAETDLGQLQVTVQQMLDCRTGGPRCMPDTARHQRWPGPGLGPWLYTKIHHAL